MGQNLEAIKEKNNDHKVRSLPLRPQEKPSKTITSLIFDLLALHKRDQTSSIGLKGTKEIRDRFQMNSLVVEILSPEKSQPKLSSFKISLTPSKEKNDIQEYTFFLSPLGEVIQAFQNIPIKENSITKREFLDKKQAEEVLRQNLPALKHLSFLVRTKIYESVENRVELPGRIKL